MGSHDLQTLKSSPPLILLNGDFDAYRLLLFEGAVNTIAIQSAQRAILFSYCETVTVQRLAAAGISEVNQVLLTQHSRLHQTGLPETFANQVIMPEKEWNLLVDNPDYWSDYKQRWHLYHSTPNRQMPICKPQAVQAICSGQAVNWQDLVIEAFSTPGPTDGSMSYVFQFDDHVNGFQMIACCGDLLCSGGRLQDVYSLQKGMNTLDYHGFLGRCDQLINSVRFLLDLDLDMIIPAHGPPIYDVTDELNILLKRLKMLAENYASISSLNYYFPGWHQKWADCLPDSAILKESPGQIRAPQYPLPAHVRYVGATSFALYSDSGNALLFDCGNKKVVSALQEQLDFGAISHVDGCLLTHYHDDHVDGLRCLYEALSCPVASLACIADIVENPLAYDLPCLSPDSVPVKRLRNAESWQWQEYRLTAYHLPGQTLYHGGFLVEGHGQKLLFAGDSFSPCGIDDYCAGNRNFLREDNGFLACLALIRQLQPDYILNAHQGQMFMFSSADISLIENALRKRRVFLTELIAWPAPEFGTDQAWVRPFPFEQKANPGEIIKLAVHFTNHSGQEAFGSAEALLPAGWESCTPPNRADVQVPPHTSGFVQADFAGGPPDGCCQLAIKISPTASGLYIVPLRITWQERYLGQLTQAIVRVG